MYHSRREKEFIIDLFINDFKVFLYERMINELAGIEDVNIDLNNSIKHTIDYLLSRLHYKEEKLTQEEIEEIVNSSDGNVVMIETDMSIGISFDWYRFMGDLDKDGFDANLVLFNLYDVYPRIASNLEDDDKELKIKELRKRVAEFIDEWFLNEQMLEHANKKNIEENFLKKSSKN